MKIQKNDDLVMRSWLLQEIEHDLGCFEIDKFVKDQTPLYANLRDIVKMILTAPKADAIQIPCKIGDFCLGDSQLQRCSSPARGQGFRDVFHP